MRQYFRGLIRFREGEYGIGLRLVRSGHSLLNPGDSAREVLTVAGQLHLGGSVVAERAGRHEWAYTLPPIPESLSLDCAIERLAANDTVLWSLSSGQQEHLPLTWTPRRWSAGQPSCPFSALLNELPGVTQPMRRDLTEAIESNC